MCHLDDKEKMSKKMSEDDERINELIFEFNMKLFVDSCYTDCFKTNPSIEKDKVNYQLAVDCLEKQLPQPPVKAIHKSVVHENRGDQPHTWRESHCELWECPRCGKTVWSGISIAKKSPYCSDCGQKIDWEDIENGKIN